MANRAALIRKADAARLLKAARESGYKRARVIAHPDGRVEIVVPQPPGGRPRRTTGPGGWRWGKSSSSCTASWRLRR